ncbi:DUF896 domain-containing protein [Vallitalea pronyensis]|uniref:UPF0291 protein HZI73_15050 n=1 Tax=Vallitalea pronyensis TaxID=1348613 RepID=A0A8J8MKU2_9FIRM|nr:DUF896 domain-containing protein [Vallitalea pronyensis]QUI23520.1 DUF896 domain-containing protein [Vallitalea pronyensis]
MEQKKLDRINALAKKAKIEGLTDEEKIEQSLLRDEYLSLVRKNFKHTMKTIKIKDQDGNIRPVVPKKKK